MQIMIREQRKTRIDVIDDTENIMYSVVVLHSEDLTAEQTATITHTIYRDIDFITHIGSKPLHMTLTALGL